MNVTQSDFGTTQNGVPVSLFTLSKELLQVSITNFGGIITELNAPDRNGKPDNIVLGFDSVEDYQSEQYLENCHYFGCIVGRISNRIRGGKFQLNGNDYQLPINDKDRHIHGGIEGFDKKVWEAQPYETSDRVGLTLKYLSKDGEEGYPGNLSVTVDYYLTRDNELVIEYTAQTDKSTIVNLTNHSYFNLSGGKENILNHYLTVPASTYTELENLIPTGKIRKVKKTPYDFRKETKIGDRTEQLVDGYDINLPLDDDSEGVCRFAGRLSDKVSGRYVEVLTTKPALQIYSGYYIPELKVNGEMKFGKYAGFALETQNYPDAINHPNFPSIVISPPKVYKHKTIYRFGVR